MLNKAIVLCAGAGTRLGELTKDKPKCLVEVGGKPALDYILWWLYSSGIRDVRVTVHHHKDVLLEYLRRANNKYSMNGQAHLAMTVAPSVEPDELLGTAGGFANAADKMSDGEILLVYGDVLTNLNIREMWWDHVCSGAEITMALYTPPNPEECGIVELDGKRLIDIYEKQRRTGLANAGVLIVRRDLRALVPSHEESDISDNLLKRYRFHVNTYLDERATVIDMGTPRGLALAEKEYYNFL